MKTRTKQTLEFLEQLNKYIKDCKQSNVEKLRTFAKFVPREDITRFLARYEIFKQVLDVQGSVVECGIFAGQSLFSFAKFSSILEHANYQRRIIGFDTFEGFVNIHDYDKSGESEHLKTGHATYGDLEDIQKAIDLFDMNRFLGHISKMEVIKGDLQHTVPKYIKSHPELMISLLNIDVDLYAPTKAIIKHLVPRVVKGGIVIFDELNSRMYPGESVAVLEDLGFNQLEIKRISFEPSMSYIVI